MKMAKSALVLSGGGSLGAVQVGMLQALSKTEFRPDMVVGSSVGALNGAFFAEDPTQEGANKLAALWRGLRRRDIFPLTFLAGLRALLFGEDHMIDACSLRSIAHRSLHIRRIEDAQIALHIVATDVLTGEEILLSSGDIDTALMASTAIPIVFPQVKLNGRYLVDGGVGGNTPVTTAIAQGAEKIIVLPTGTSCALEEPPKNMAALALHVMGLQNMRQLDRDVERFGAQADIRIVPPLCPMDVSVFDLLPPV